MTKTKMQNIKHWFRVIKLSIDVRTEKLSDGVQVVFTCPASHFSPIIQTVVNNLVFCCWVFLQNFYRLQISKLAQLLFSSSDWIRTEQNPNVIVKGELTNVTIHGDFNLLRLGHGRVTHNLPFPHLWTIST